MPRLGDGPRGVSPEAHRPTKASDSMFRLVGSVRWHGRPRFLSVARHYFICSRKTIATILSSSLHTTYPHAPLAQSSRPSPLRSFPPLATITHSQSSQLRHSAQRLCLVVHYDFFARPICSGAHSIRVICEMLILAAQAHLSVVHLLCLPIDAQPLQQRPQHDRHALRLRARVR